MTHRKTYDTRVKYLVRKGLLPDMYQRQIHRSLISKWKRESPEKYVGYELNDSIEELYELMKGIAEDQRLQKALIAFYRINRTLRDMIGGGEEYISKLKGNKEQVVNTILRARKSLTLKRAVKLMGISQSTYRLWAKEVYFKCNHSLSKLCNNSYPQQLTVREIRKMHRLLSREQFLHWPIISVAYYGLRQSILKAHPNTWYKYARLMKVKRKRRVKRRIKYEEGLRASAPNEKWHADVTEYQTVDGKTSFIYLVVDNFSRYIISWRVSDKVCARVRLETFREAFLKMRQTRVRGKRKKLQIIVDGGTENNNVSVNTFVEDHSLQKVIALRDIEKSNSMAEAVNKTVKYDYLFPRKIYDQQQLVNVIGKIVVPDYNTKRPHGALSGLTPIESYSRKRVDLKKLLNGMKQAKTDRVEYNRSHSCLGCPFGCKQGP